MRNSFFYGIVCFFVLALIPGAIFAAPNMNVTFVSGSGTYDVGTSFDGFTAKSNDPTGPFSGQPVVFKGTEEDTGQSLIARYLIKFSETVNLKEIILQGVAFNGNSYMKLLDANMNEIEIAGMWGGNSFQTFFLIVPNDGISGDTFFLEEYDESSGWRYRSNIKVVINEDPLVLRKIQWWTNYIVRADHEDGRIRRWTGFAMEDQNGNTISENVVGSVTLYDPDGIEVSPTELNDEPYLTMNGRYIADTGQWEYDDDFHLVSGEYYLNFNEVPLKTGMYHIQVTDVDGYIHEGYNYYAGPVELPMIYSHTLRGYEDDSGNFMWTWSVPYTYDPNIETRSRASVLIYNNNEFIADVYISLPTHLAHVFIPSSTFQKIKARGNRLTVRSRLRERTSRVRKYSNEVDIANLPPVGYSDIDGNGKTDLRETIHCLQIVSGVK